MIRISGGIFQASNAVPMAIPFRHAPPRLSQAQRAPTESPTVVFARTQRDQALAHLKSVEDNLSMLDEIMGPEAALQALEEGRQSVEQAQAALEEALSESALKTGILE